MGTCCAGGIDGKVVERMRQLHPAAVGAHQPPFAQQDAAEIAGDHRADVADAAVLQHREHGLAGRAVGLAVVAVADLAAAARRAGQVGPAVVGGIAEFRPQLVDEGARVLHRGGVGQGGDEAAAVDLLLDAVNAGRNGVALTHLPQNASASASICSSRV